MTCIVLEFGSFPGQVNDNLARQSIEAFDVRLTWYLYIFFAKSTQLLRFKIRNLAGKTDCTTDWTRFEMNQYAKLVINNVIYSC